MGKLQIRVLGDPVLRERGRDVDAFDAALWRLADDMLETMYDAPGVGLAAQQVGLSLRLFVYDPGDGTGSGAVANPEVTLLEEEGEIEQDEGCLSIPGHYFPTRRAARVRLSGQDLDGRPIVAEADGLLARIFQHETDHTNGMLFVDRLDPDARRAAMAQINAGELDLRALKGRGAGD